MSKTSSMNSSIMLVVDSRLKEKFSEVEKENLETKEELKELSLIVKSLRKEREKLPEN